MYIFSSPVLKKKSSYFDYCNFVVVIQKLHFRPLNDYEDISMNMKLRILTYHDKRQLLDKGHYSAAIFCQSGYLNRRSLSLPTVLLFWISFDFIMRCVTVPFSSNEKKMLIYMNRQNFVISETYLKILFRATSPAGRVASNFYLSCMLCFSSCIFDLIFKINFADA
jgi:hypothetical protein